MINLGNEQQKIKIDISEEEILKRISQIEKLAIDDEFREFLISALEALVCLDKMLSMKETTIFRLRRIFNKKKELFQKSTNNADTSAHPHSEDPGKNEGKPPAPRGNNKGKNGAEKYKGAKKVYHPLMAVSPNQLCPSCKEGKLYDYIPGLYIRITGSAPLTATVHETQKLRCNTCLEIFEADFEGKDAPKYDERAKAIIALLKYRASMPFYRLQKIQDQLYMPMPASTQWDLIEDLLNDIYPAWIELLKVAPTGVVFHQDDTKGKVLSLIKDNKINPDKKRKGIFTSCLMAELKDGKKITLFFTGHKYSGENLSDLIKDYTFEAPPIVMSDALATNKIKTKEVLTALCLAHARRGFFNLSEYAQKEADNVLNLIHEVYKIEREAKDKNLSQEERLKLHQGHSAPQMNKLKQWCEESFESKKVEPNSSLGKAIKYTLKHWEGLTAFLRIPGAPLDNNILEQEIRQSVLNRKNWYFYKTEIGAIAGDVILSLIKTCEGNEINTFEYLVWLQKNKDELKKDPSKFMPWNFMPVSSG